MRYSNQFKSHGYIMTAPKQGRKQKERDVTEKNRIKDICLNCKDPKCSGSCRKFSKKVIN
jgi:Fe-S-cluster-containing dehydrogenase component